MPPRTRKVGPRVTLDIAILTNMPKESRLRLLTRSMTEGGGRSDTEWGENFRQLLTKRIQQKSWRGRVNEIRPKHRIIP